MKGFEPGQIAVVNTKELAVQTGEGSLYLKEVQLEGKKRMEIEDFLRGYHFSEGKAFSREK